MAIRKRFADERRTEIQTVSGEVDFDFPFRYQGSTAVYGDGSGPCYSMTTVSGDLSLERY